MRIAETSLDAPGVAEVKQEPGPEAVDVVVGVGAFELDVLGALGELDHADGGGRRLRRAGGRDLHLVAEDDRQILAVGTLDEVGDDEVIQADDEEVVLFQLRYSEFDYLAKSNLVY